MYLRLLKAGKRFSYCPDTGAVYRKWNDDSICEKDKLGTYRQRLKITNEVESYLKLTEELTLERQNEINQARFECARILWTIDRTWAKQIITQIQETGVSFTPEGQGVPYLYRLLYKVFGFSVTENIAEVKRELRRIYTLNH